VLAVKHLRSLAIGLMFVACAENAIGATLPAGVYAGNGPGFFVALDAKSSPYVLRFWFERTVGGTVTEVHYAVRESSGGGFLITDNGAPCERVVVADNGSGLVTIRYGTLSLRLAATDEATVVDGADSLRKTAIEYSNLRPKPTVTAYYSPVLPKCARAQKDAAH
jgi:hypothetical protein